MMKEQGRIVTGNGMGGFLCPPTHPMHTQHVETDLRRRPENRGRESLEYAVEDETLTNATRAAARTVLNSWKAPPLDSEEIRGWVLQVLGYFRGSYNMTLTEEGWHCDKMTFDHELDPMDHIENHAGVHLIRKYYPDFTPTREDFEQAYWGTKP
jgi:hypothetical protein